MGSIVTVRKNNMRGGDNYIAAIKPAAGRPRTDIGAGMDAGDAAATAVSLAIENSPCIIIACKDVSDLVPVEFKNI